MLSFQPTLPTSASSSREDPFRWSQRLLAWVGESSALGSSIGRGALKWLALAGCVGLFLKHALYIRELFLGNACDDAFISFRYLRLFVDHFELAYNLGERVEGYSNLLWILLLAPLDLMGVEPVLASQVLGVSLGVLAMLVACVCVRTHLGAQSFVAQLSVGLILASSGFFSSWAVMGLESMLHGLLLLSALVLYMRELDQPRLWGWSAVCLGALVMTRPEGLLVAGGAFVFRMGVDLWRSKILGKPRPNMSFYWVVLGVIVAFEVFRVSYFGWYLWPNAVRAKVGGNSDQYVRGLDYVRVNFVTHYSYLFVAVMAVGAWLKKYPARSAATVLFLGYVAFYALAGGDWSVGRFFAPLMPLGALCFGCVVDDLAGKASGRLRFLSQSLACLTVASLAYYSYLGSSKHGEQNFARGFAGMDARRVEFGKWINKHAPKDASVALYAAGQIAYFANRYAHDMLGLNDRHIAAIEPTSFGKGPAGHEKFDVNYTLNEIRPTIIVQPWLIPGLMQHPTFVKDYQVLPPFPEAWVLKSSWGSFRKPAF